MRNFTRKILALYILTGACTIAVHAGAPIVKNQTTGPYTVTLKILPAQTFTGPNAQMAWDGGAKAVPLYYSPRPNHHMVAFIQKKGKPVVKAKVAIRYRMITPVKSRWGDLPVARIHVAGKDLKTTHYGNNVFLADGWYEVTVSVNGGPPARFRFRIGPQKHQEKPLNMND